MSPMNSPPAWVPYVSLGLAGLSLLVAAISATYASRTFNRAGVRVRVSSTWFSAGEDAVRVHVRVTNRGLAPVGLRGIRVGLHIAPLLIPLGHVPTGDTRYGPALPYRLEGSDTQEWMFDTRSIFDRTTAREAARAYVRATQGNTLKLALRPQTLRFAGRFMFLPLRAIRTFMGLQLAVELGNGVEARSRASIRTVLHLRKEILLTFIKIRNEAVS
jgi:hypothetical protein